ncbi:MAG: glycosyltransferase [Desulfosporosinus sp.]|nr:glycosyltransferase [Desulfosporosinus sp.]
MTIKTLIVAPCPVSDRVAHAGGRVLNFYLNKFYNDPQFEVALLMITISNDRDYDYMIEEYPKCLNFSQEIKQLPRVFRYIYNKSVKKIAVQIYGKRSIIDPFTERYLNKGIKQILNSGWDPDIVILEWTQTIIFSSTIKQFFPNARLFGTEQDVFFQGLSRRNITSGIFQRWNNRIIALEKEVELSAISYLNFVTVYNNKDKELLLDEGVEDIKIQVIAPYFSKYERNYSKKIQNKILFFGAMNRWENQEAVEWFIKKVFIPVYNLDCELEFCIVGGNVPKDFIGRVEVSGVTFTGFVDDPTRLFSESFCMVAPLHYGAGIKIKVLEGMAAGLPVLTGDIGIEGIEAVPIRHYIHCEKESDYIQAIMNLKELPENGIQVGSEAKRHVQMKFDYNEGYEIYKSNMLSLME